MSSQTGTLYVGMTNDLNRRIFEHKQGLAEGFTKKYQCDELIYFEESSDVRAILAREKQIKRWNRQKKIELVKQTNPELKDLSTLVEMT